MYVNVIELRLCSHYVEILEELEARCHDENTWVSLCKPVADSIIEMRDNFNLHFKLPRDAEFKESAYYTCIPCFVAIKKTHYWLFNERMHDVRCQHCLRKIIT